MEYKYGTFTTNQIAETKCKLRKQIFFLLLIVDPETCGNYENIDVPSAFDNIMYMIGGLNKLLDYPQQLVTVMSLLQSALDEYLDPDFDYEVYRKLVLDAGNEVQKIKEVI